MPEVLEVKNELSHVIDYGLAIEDLKTKVEADLALTIDGVKDRAGYKLCDQRRKEWVKVRTGIDRTRKELNAAAREHIKRVDSVAAELTSMAGEAEDHVTRLVDAIDEQVAKEKRDAEDAVFNARNAQLQHVGLNLPRVLIESLSDADIAKQIEDKIETDRLRAAETERRAAEKAAAEKAAAEELSRIKAEAEKLAAERAAFERQKAEQAAEFAKLQEAQAEQQRAIEAEKKRLADIETARIEKEQAEQRAKDKAEHERVEAERLKVLAEQAAIDAAEKLKREQREAQEAADIAEALRPDREKLLSFAQAIVDMSGHLPEVSAAVQGTRLLVLSAVSECVRQIRQIIRDKM